MNSPVKIWRNQKSIRDRIGKRGTIATWTYIRVPPSEYADQAPYPVVLVQLHDGGTLIAQLVDWKSEQLVIGQEVVTVVRRVIQPDASGVIPYGIKVKPV